MSTKLGMMLAVVALLVFVSGVRADDAKTVTLTGKLECGMCTLHQTKECTNVLAVKDGDKETLYWLVDNDVSKTQHGQVCHAPKDGVTVTGTVEAKDGKNYLTATKIVFPAEATKGG